VATLRVPRAWVHGNGLCPSTLPLWRLYQVSQIDHFYSTDSIKDAFVLLAQVLILLINGLVSLFFLTSWTFLTTFETRAGSDLFGLPRCSLLSNAAPLT
jgi:hypothetical protein